MLLHVSTHGWAPASADGLHGTLLQDVRKQLLQTMDRYKLDLVSAGRDQKKILMAVTSGFFFHAARKDPQDGAGVFTRYTPVLTEAGKVVRPRDLLHSGL